jgi:ectoine hydroxylase-related dioxygenase (phytanoyl-CoA dioxygenase family)
MAYLTKAQVKQFNEEGYLLVEAVFDPEADLDPIIEEYKRVLEHLAQELYTEGKIASLYAELPFGERLTQIYAESGKVHAQYFDFSLPKGNIKTDTPMWVGPAVFRAMRNEKLLDVVESIIGPEIYSNPVQHVRIKPPEHLTPKDPDTGQVQLGATPWHQDNGVVLPEADETEMLTVWFPLLDANIENGCLAVVPRSHREGLLTHCPTPVIGLHIPDPLLRMNEMTPIPMERGDVLLMHRLTCHCSLSNISNHIRWSFDLRYNPIGQPTGREAFPGFVARSRSKPASELRSPEAWAELWYETRYRLAVEEFNAPFDRWEGKELACA